MRAWHIADNFSIKNLKIAQVVQGPLRQDQVRVKIHACSLNYRDLMVIKGHYNPKQTLPLIPLSDGAGEVIEVGSSVSEFKVGDRVCGTFSQNWCHGGPTVEAHNATLGSPLPGVLSEVRDFGEQGLIQFPDYLSYEEASCLPCAGVTAFNTIAFQSQLGAGDTVLLLGTGGVSLFALQFAKAFGLKALITSGSSDKLQKAQRLGADGLINYREHPKWSRMVLELTKGCGVDAVVEVGGAQTLTESILSTKKAGVVCVIGVLSGSQEPVDLRPILMNTIRLQGIFVGAKTVFSAMNRVLAYQKIHPVIDRVFSFSEAQEAFSYLESAQHFGKVVIKV